MRVKNYLSSFDVISLGYLDAWPLCRFYEMTWNDYEMFWIFRYITTTFNMYTLEKCILILFKIVKYMINIIESRGIHLIQEDKFQKTELWKMCWNDKYFSKLLNSFVFKWFLFYLALKKIIDESTIICSLPIAKELEKLSRLWIFEWVFILSISLEVQKYPDFRHQCFLKFENTAE